MKIFMPLVVIVVMLSPSCSIEPINPQNETTQITQDVHEVMTNPEMMPSPSSDNTIIIYTYENGSQYSESLAAYYVSIYASGYLYNKYNMVFNEYSSRIGIGASYEAYGIDLITRLLAGDSTFDIYEIYPDEMNVMPLIENNYYVDLSANTEYLSRFNKMYPSLQLAATHEDKIFGFPYMVYYPTNIAYSADNLSDKDLEFRNIRTFDRLFSLVEESDASIRLDNEIIEHEFIKALLFKNFDRETYNINFVGLDIKTSKDIVNQIRDSSYFSGDFNLAYPNTKQLEEMCDYNVFKHINISKNPLSNIINPLYVNEEAMGESRVGFMKFYIINPYSEKIDIAQELILDYSKVLSVMPAQNSPVTDITRLQQYIYNNIDMYVDNDLGMPPPENISQEMLDVYGNIIEDMECYWQFPGFLECAEIIQQYYDDEIDEDEAKTKMQKIMDNVSKEYTLN